MDAQPEPQPDPEPEPEPQPIPQPAPGAHRRRRQRSPIHQDVPEQEIDLRYLSQQISRVDLSREHDMRRIEHDMRRIEHDRQRLDRDILRRQVHDQWVSRSMQEFYASQGFQPSIPYPTYVPPVPTWFVPPDFLHDYGDGGGTSGSNRRWHSVQQTSSVESVLKTERPITQGDCELKICNQEFHRKSRVSKEKLLDREEGAEFKPWNEENGVKDLSGKEEPKKSVFETKKRRN
ncbi:hypothetical protein L2E82_30939 [Cichorium intybus]|uniref:Uncharacterized protein n=1 Tax=Cichorium intybus TaxID=13427 RepID=A0ACB9D1T8_CICIN|nr:hypothetical protein L2E82_30939 [Cichorium intybus]